jgi:hypothetical protein
MRRLDRLQATPIAGTVGADRSILFSGRPMGASQLTAI